MYIDIYSVTHVVHSLNDLNHTQSERHKVKQHIPVDTKRLNILQS